VISSAAIATGIAAWVGPEDKQVAQVAAPVERAHATPVNVAGASRPQALTTQLPTREPIGRQRGDLFATRSWAPKPAASNEPPPKPQPPANPYKFAGTVHHDGHRKVFLILGDGRVVEAKEGEMLEQGFRVKSVSDSAVTLVYEQIPDQPVTIAFTDPGTAAASGASAPPAASSPPKQ
jgi:hypothetical protein